MVINVSDSENSANNILYLQSSLGEILSNANCNLTRYENSSRSGLKLNCPEHYGDIIKTEVCDKVAEIVAINYKYNFFKNNIKVSGLNQLEKEILYASLIAADLPEDKRYCFEKYKDLEEIAVDGVFNFRLIPLKKKWNEIASYMPTCFISSQLKDFIKYLIEKKRKRAYIDCGKVYDSHYRRLKRVELLGGDKAKIVREVLLSNSGEIEVNGKLPEEDEYYLKEFFGERVFFN